MKKVFLLAVIGLALIFSACCLAQDFIKATPMKVVLTDRNFVNTTLVKTEEGVYRLFIIEGRNGGGVGISAVKIEEY